MRQRTVAKPFDETHWPSVLTAWGAEPEWLANDEERTLTAPSLFLYYLAKHAPETSRLLNLTIA